MAKEDMLFNSSYEWIKSRYLDYKQSYLLHLRKLGYGNHNGDFDWFFIKRAFILSWGKPGFHYFWRYWNPGINFFTFKLFHLLGGNKRRSLSTILTFLICGMCHSLVVLPFLGWSYTIPVTFMCFGVLTVLSSKSEILLKQRNWHWIINATINILLVILSFDIGFRINKIIS